MFRRVKNSREVVAAMRSAEEILPLSGEVEDLLANFSRKRGRPMVLLSTPFVQSVSGALLCTRQTDYVAVSEHTSPERTCAIICHEVAHGLLEHDHKGSLSSSLVETGLMDGIDPELIDAVVAARKAYAHTAESDAEVVATRISVELRRRVMRGGHTHYDQLWR